jgi:hypothetical protein
MLRVSISSLSAAAASLVGGPGRGMAEDGLGGGRRAGRAGRESCRGSGGGRSGGGGPGQLGMLCSERGEVELGELYRAVCDRPDTDSHCGSVIDASACLADASACLAEAYLACGRVIDA